MGGTGLPVPQLPPGEPRAGCGCPCGEHSVPRTPYLRLLRCALTQNLRLSLMMLRFFWRLEIGLPTWVSSISASPKMLVRTQVCETNNINKPIKLADNGTSVFGYLVNLTTLTPAAVAHTVTLFAV